MYLNKSFSVMHVYSYFAIINKTASAAEMEMEDPVVLVTFLVSIVVDVVQLDADVHDGEARGVGEAAHDRLGNCLVECCGTLYACIFIIIINYYLKVIKFGV